MPEPEKSTMTEEDDIKAPEEIIGELSEEVSELEEKLKTPELAEEVILAVYQLRGKVRGMLFLVERHRQHASRSAIVGEKIKRKPRGRFVQGVLKVLGHEDEIDLLSKEHDVLYPALGKLLERLNLILHELTN